jgi:hypothetical protein
MEATEIPEFKPKKSLNMAQLAANMKEEMTVLFGSKPENLTFAGFRIYCLDKKEGYLSATSYLSKGIDLAAFGSEDQAVKIDPSLPDYDKKLLLRGSALIYASMLSWRVSGPRIMRSCRHVAPSGRRPNSSKTQLPLWIRCWRNILQLSKPGQSMMTWRAK